MAFHDYFAAFQGTIMHHPSKKKSPSAKRFDS
jgi:hypothetical protein